MFFWESGARSFCIRPHLGGREPVRTRIRPGGGWRSGTIAILLTVSAGEAKVGIPQSQSVPWTRKHDKPGVPLIPAASLIQYPQSLADLITICSQRPPTQRLHAAGSHWALSYAAVSDYTFIETHDWNNIVPAMGRTLYDVVPGCMSTAFLNQLNLLTTDPALATVPVYYVHFEAGKRIYQLYAELDVGDGANSQSLCGVMKSQFGNPSFGGSWAFATLGGAAGQTVVGALSTGTHGGDFDRPPIADSVLALHVVVDGGKHYWIESKQYQFTDESKLVALYGVAQYGGPNNFEVIYDDNVLRAAMVQVGRFGIVYSAVMQVQRQYGLREELVLDTWENVQNSIADPDSPLFNESFTTADGEVIPQRFLQIVIDPIPSTNGTTHICGITRRWTVPVSSLPPSPMPAVNWGGGKPAGRSVTRPTTTGSPRSISMTSACADANFMDGIVSGIYTEIENFLSSNAVAIGGGLAGAIAAGLGPGILALAPWLAAILSLLALFLNSLRSGGSTVGQALNNLRASLLGSSDPEQRAAGILVWRAIAAEVFKFQQKPQTYSAISYAIMDTHNYQDISCDVNVRSKEVFFDAAEPNSARFHQSPSAVRDRSRICFRLLGCRLCLAALLWKIQRDDCARGFRADLRRRMFGTGGRDGQHPVRGLCGQARARSEHQGHPALGPAEFEHPAGGRIPLRGFAEQPDGLAATMASRARAAHR